MKRYLIFLVSMLSSISFINAGSGSFWGGFGLGTFSGIMGSKIAHHVHRPCKEVIVQPVEYVEVQKPAPRYVEVKTVKTEPVFYGSTSTLKEENKILEVENQRLKCQLDSVQGDLQVAHSKNRALSSKINILDDTLDTTQAENRILAKQIDLLTTKTDQLERSLKNIQQTMKQTSL